MKKALLAVVVATACSMAAYSQEPSVKAHQLAQKHILVDTHIDVPIRLVEGWEDVTKATAKGDFDYPRALAGGLNAPFMSIYIPARYEQSGGGDQLANMMIDLTEAIVARAPQKFTMAASVDEVERAFADGKIALAMGMENGTPIAGDFAKLQHFYERGIRYITLAHSESNHIADSSYDLRRQWKGLSPFGKELVAEMNRLGMMVDISHVSDQAFYQAIEISKAPVIASHSSLRKFTPGFERNMDDDMLRALAKNGGVIQINFGSSFINQTARDWYSKRDKVRDSVEGDAAKQAVDDYKATNPFPFATLEDVLNHIDYVVKLIGIDHVGIGSDFDGVGDSLPENLKDVSYYPYLIQGLLDRGYKDEEIAQIMGGNTLRLWRQVEQIAENLQKSS